MQYFIAKCVPKTAKKIKYRGLKKNACSNIIGTRNFGSVLVFSMNKKDVDVMAEIKQDRAQTEEIPLILKTLLTDGINVVELVLINQLAKQSKNQMEAFSNVYMLGVAKGKGLF